MQVVLVFIVDMAAQEPFGIAALGQGLQIGHQAAVKLTTRHRIIDGLAIHLGGPCAVKVRLGAALDLQRMHAHFRQPRHMLYSTQILGVHDVSTVFVLERGHRFIGTVGFVQYKHFVSRRAHAQGWLDHIDDIAQFVFRGRFGVVFPAAGIGAAALIGIALVHVAGQQAAP